VYDKDFESKRQEYVERTVPVWLTHFERIISRGAGDWFANDRFSVADVVAFDVLSVHYELDSLCLNPYPKLSAFLQRVLNRPKISAYLKSDRRPKHAHGSSAFWNNAAKPAPPLPL